MLALVATGLMLAISPLLALLLTHGRPGSAHRTALFSLLILVPAAYLQIHGGALSATLSAMSRYPVSIAIYVVSGTTALGSSIVISTQIGVLGAGIGVSVGAVFLVIGHSLYLRRFGIYVSPRPKALRERATARFGFYLLAGAALGASLQLNLAVALSALSRPPGVVTVYSYAYYGVAMMLNLSSAPVSVVMLPRLMDALATKGRAALRDQLLAVVPYVFCVLMPMIAGFIAFGKPLLEVLLSPELSQHGIDQLYGLAIVLTLMVISASLFTLVGSLLLALREWNKVFYVAVTGVIVHVVAIYGVARFGAFAVASAHAAATALMAVVLLRATFGSDFVGVLGAVIRRTAPAFGLSIVFPVVSAGFGAHPSAAAALGGLAVGCVGYGALAVVLWPKVAGPFVTLARQIRPFRSRTSTA